MLRRLMVCLGLLGTFAPTAQALEVQFIGGLYILISTANCTGVNMTGVYSARFRPAGVADNGTRSDFNLHRNDFAEGHRLLSGTFSSSFKNVQAVRVGGGSGEITGVKVRFTEQTRVDVNSTFVNVKGDIRNFAGTADAMSRSSMPASEPRLRLGALFRAGVAS